MSAFQPGNFTSEGVKDYYTEWKRVKRITHSSYVKMMVETEGGFALCLPVCV